ncbi:hypothetical protein [Frankia sp. CcWB2]
MARTREDRGRVGLSVHLANHTANHTANRVVGYDPGMPRSDPLDVERTIGVP